MRLPFYVWGFVAIFVGFFIYLIWIAESGANPGFYVYALGLVLIAVLSYSMGIQFETKEARRISLDTPHYFTKLVESHRDMTQKDLELIYGKFSDIMTPLWIFLIGIAAIEAPKEIAGIQPFGTIFTYVLVIGGLTIVVLALAMVIVKNLNPLSVQNRYFEDYLKAKKSIVQRERERRDSTIFE